MQRIVPTTPNPSEGLQLTPTRFEVNFSVVPTTPNPSEGLQRSGVGTVIILPLVPTTPNPSEGLQQKFRQSDRGQTACPNHPQPVRGIATNGLLSTSARRAKSQPPPTRPRDCNRREARVEVCLCLSQPPPTRPRDCNWEGEGAGGGDSVVPTTPNPSEGLQRQAASHQGYAATPSQPPPTRPRDCNRRMSQATDRYYDGPNHPQPVRGIATDLLPATACQFPLVPTTPNPSEGLQP